jgi:phosphoribosylanthranilate isomerase
VTLVKVCGIRSLDDGRAALQAGADLLGFIFWQPGKRYIPPPTAAGIISALRAERRDWRAVGVFVDPDPAEVAEAAAVCSLDYVQLSGHEPASLVGSMPRPTIKAVHVRAGEEAAAAEVVETNALGADIYLLDTHARGLPGGTGVAFDWRETPLRQVAPRCLVAGGLNPNNVRTALDALNPFGVDVSSGVEFPNGGKDPRAVKSFLEAVRSHDSHPV